MEDPELQKEFDFENGGDGSPSDRNEDDVADNTKSIECIHSEISVQTIPKVDMEFESEEAYNFYNYYAYNVGFSICRTSAHKDSHGKTKNRTF